MIPIPALWDYAVDVEVLEALPTIYENLTAAERSALIEAILAGPPHDGGARSRSTEDSIENQVYLRLEALGEQARDDHLAARERHRAILDSHSSWAGSLEGRMTRREPQAYYRSLVKTVEAEVDPEVLIAEILSRGVDGADEFHTIAGLSMATRGITIKRACTRKDGAKVVRVLLSIGKDDLADDASRKRLLSMLCELPAGVAGQAHREVASLLEMLSERIEPSDADRFLSVWDKIISTCLGVRGEVFADGPPDHLTAAINSSAGGATRALLRLLGKMDLQRAGRIAPPFRDRLEVAIRSPEPGAFYARVLAASHLYLLSWLDLGWTQAELIPFLSWKDPLEAAGAWQGYLWSPRMDGKLFDAIRGDFVETFSHVKELGRMEEGLCGLLVSLALDAPGKMTAEETRQCLREMDTPSRRRVAWLLAKRLEATEEEKRPDLWRDRIDSWISQHWPVEADYVDGEVSERLAWAATLTGTAFPDAVATIQPLVSPARNPLLALQALRDSDLCDRFPDGCLRLLDRLLGAGEDRQFLRGLGSLLKSIRTARPALAATRAYVRLQELAQSLGDSS